MYKQSTVDGEDMALMATAPRPLGPAFTADQVEKADSMEVWCSGVLDQQECTEFRLMKGGRVVANVVIPGY